MPIHTEVVEYLTNTTDLKAVADAIRTKGGTSGALVYPDGFVSAINAITTGGGQDEYAAAALISNVGTIFPATYKNTVATKVKDTCFNGYTKLISVEFPMVTSVGTQAFQNCLSLKKADFSVLTSINIWAFNACRALEALIIRTNSVCTLAGTNAFANNSGIAAGTGYVYVPSALVDSYKAATNWSTYADQIRAIEDYPSITGG